MPCFFPVGTQRVQNCIELLPGVGGDGFDKRFHPALQVPVQQVTGTDEETLFGAFAEAVDPGMLEPAADDPRNRDVFA